MLRGRMGGNGQSGVVGHPKPGVNRRRYVGRQGCIDSRSRGVHQHQFDTERMKQCQVVH